METNANPVRPIGPPLPTTEPEKEVKKFEAAKNSADRSKEDNVPNGGPQHRGPLEGGATGGSPTPSADKRTGFDGAGGFLRGQWDFGPKGLELKKVEVGGTAHADWMPGRGIGPGLKDGKPGVAEGDGKGGGVTTPADVKGDAKKDGAAGAGKSGGNAGIEGLDWSKGTRIKGQEMKEFKSAIPPAPPRQINDLGPSTNEPDQKPADAAVAQNDRRLGDDLAQRI